MRLDSASPHGLLRGLLLASTVGALCLVSGCAQDPYAIPNYGEGGIPGIEAGFPDAIAPGDFGPRDLRLDKTNTPDLRPDACVPQIELCNNLDDNCDKQIDEGFDKLGDARYCENCKGCKDLYSKNAVPACSNGKCVVGTCTGGWIDLDKDPKNGCEYECTPTAAVEVCDGVDNDCNGQVDDLPTTCGVDGDCVGSFGASSKCINNACTPPAICKTGGPCAGTQAVCQGAKGWVCSYGAQVELQPCTQDSDCGGSVKCQNNVCPGVVRTDEALCDGLDGDCDGLADDPWKKPGLSTAIGKACDPTKPCTKDSDCGGAGSTCDLNQNTCTAKKGVCRDAGEYICDPSDASKTTCKLLTAGQSPTQETCNGKDDNCDGVVDDSPTDEAWVTFTSGSQTVTIFKYEASRPDATASAVGILSTGRPCSVPGRLPWANVTKVEAQAACALAGGRLCTVAEWQAACRGTANTAFPYGNSYQPNTCNGRAFDTDSAQAGNQDEVLPTNQPSSCTSSWAAAGTIFNMSGNLKEWVVTSYSGANAAGYELRGGAFDTPSLGGYGAGLGCNYQLPDPEPVGTGTLRISTLGFRCCK